MCDQLSNCPVKGLKLTQLLLEILPTSFFFFFNLVTKISK